ncbi:MAG: hypothetical protein M3072_09250 [Candidatus Dormibacteraeota bacterium]|nr:hypothetical protein [Candidatus Dormibacteraeota bacterium]
MGHKSRRQVPIGPYFADFAGSLRGDGHRSPRGLRSRERGWR